MEQIEYAISIDANRPSNGWRIGLVALGIHKAGLGRISHSHGAAFTSFTMVQSILDAVLILVLVLILGACSSVGSRACSLRDRPSIIMFLAYDALKDGVMNVLVRSVATRWLLGQRGLGRDSAATLSLGSHCEGEKRGALSDRVGTVGTITARSKG